MQAILVNGPSATGKTTLARRISKETGLKLISKDELKEELVEKGYKKPTLGNWLYFDNASKQKLYEVLQTAIDNKTDVIIEADFRPDQHEKLAKLLEPAVTKEIYCKCKPWTMLKRYRNRSKNGLRAKVHQNWFWYPLFIPALIFPFLITRSYPFISFVNKRLIVDTDQGIDFKAVLDFLKN